MSVWDYRMVVDGEEPDIAFAAAQRALFDGDGDDMWRHFYHWSPFQMIGW